MTGFGTPVYHRQQFVRAYNRHVEEVKDYFKRRNDLLILNICDGDGWVRLCRFLGKPVPDEPFPWENKHNAS